ncbi:MAG: hypothetical protein EWV40_03530 [Microcystis flos-aquae Mf_WU_F_19750830_S460]|uniref:Uncharacterized protein n=1 Tax=Microcystis flos-aquae Mf_WU_F_19750830_S460 TaxID=2486237 RepID=A0A552M0R3_9CHRO|nr:MAG: hypothetical protein EWV40_03530 [Microcystis flos-aquae Mf_WU_F_19750830_S460]
MQTITTLIFTGITIGTIVFRFGEEKNKLENLENEQKAIASEVKEMRSGLKNFYTREEAEKDFAILDCLWEAKYQVLEKSQSKKSY